LRRWTDPLIPAIWSKRTTQDSRDCADNQFMGGERLNSEEDAELRRLHVLRTFGNVASSVHSRYEALRGRDRRKAIRDPDESTLAVPIEKKLWADKPMPVPRPVEVPEQVAEVDVPEEEAFPSGAERPKGDSREILAESPEARRGLGIFRR
jgi:hypothetical protein